MWVLVMMGMAAALLYNIVEMTKKYLSYPISVKFNVDHQPQLTFPTVAMCNMSPIKKSSLESAQTVKRRKKRSVGRCMHFVLFVCGYFRRKHSTNFVINETVNEDLSSARNVNFYVNKPR